MNRSLINISSVLMLVLILWSGSYLALRQLSGKSHFGGSTWHDLFSPNPSMTVPDWLFPYTAVYHPLQFIDDRISGKFLVFQSNRFGIGATARF